MSRDPSYQIGNDCSEKASKILTKISQELKSLQLWRKGRGNSKGKR